MTHNELITLAKHAAHGTAPANYSVNQVNEAFLDGLRELCPRGEFNTFMKNRYDVYDIIIEAAEQDLPRNALGEMAPFVEFRQVEQGNTVRFRKKLGRNRAKKFLTQVGLSGVYETFRLDHSDFEVKAHAVGGAATVGFERVLDGAESMAEVVSVITEGLNESVYVEVQRALRAAINAANRPAANKVVATEFDSDKMFKLVTIARAYGDNATIFATPEFIQAMGPDAIVPVPASGNYGGVYAPQDIDAIHNTGYINIFRGTPIVQLRQSYTDENNNKTYLDPQMAYILPSGGEKPIKVVREGKSVMWDRTNEDQSMEWRVYQKIGVAVLYNHNWCIYQNTGIEQTMDDTLYGI